MRDATALYVVTLHVIIRAWGARQPVLVLRWLSDKVVWCAHEAGHALWCLSSVCTERCRPQGACQHVLGAQSHLGRPSTPLAKCESCCWQACQWARCWQVEETRERTVIPKKTPEDFAEDMFEYMEVIFLTINPKTG